MARVDPNQGLMPSILDRLIDPDSAGTTWLRGYGVDQMLDAVRRDLEDLFNTHDARIDLPGGLPEVERSILAYGLPDLPSLYIAAGRRKEDIGRLLEGIIRQFEPRLLDIKARLIEGGTEKERRVRFHIEARLAVDPSPEVAFETVLELATGQTSIRPAEAPAR